MIKLINYFYYFYCHYLQIILLFFRELFYNFRMKYTEITIPNDQKILQNIVFEQQEKLDDQQKTLDLIRQQYDNLQHQVKCLLRHQYGQKSEQGIPGQASLFNTQGEAELNTLETEAALQTIPSHQRKKPRKGQRQFPTDLPRQRIEYDLPEEKKRCACGCGQALKKIGEEILEQLEIVPAKMYVIEHVRFKYAGCGIEPTVITADMPRQPLDKSMAGPGLLADVLVKKYDDHLPLYRQSEIFARHGIDIARSTLCDWVGACATAVEPIVGRMQPVVLTAPKIHTDDTPVPVLDPGSGKTKTGRLWIYLGMGQNAPPCAVYEYTPTRQQTGPMAFLKGYQGYLQADAYQGYDILYSEKQVDYHIIEIACWAHARRKFFEIAKQSKTVDTAAHQALSFIQKLYQIEREAHDFDDEARQQYRQEKSKPVLAAFKEWLDQLKDRVLPKSPLGDAVNYTLNNWQALNGYVDNGMLSIDNNAAERLIKPIKIGVKNYLFAGSDQGARNAAIFYSLIETCKLHQINPYDYLRDVLIRLPTQLNSQLDELLPWNWKPLSAQPQNQTL